MTSRRGNGSRRLAVVVAAAAALVLVPASAAHAACHAFTVEVDPASVAEGSEVTVTVSRDAGVGPSQIDVETVDGTATGGADYEPVPRRTVSFSSETSQSFPVPTMGDADSESAETFALHLSNPGGCAVNPNFVVGPDVTVTITDDDAPGTTAAPRPATTAGRPTTTTDADQSTSSSSTDTSASTTSSSTTSSASTTSDEVAVTPVRDDDDGGSRAVVLIIAILVVLAAGGGAAWAWRRRQQAS